MAHAVAGHTSLHGEPYSGRGCAEGCLEAPTALHALACTNPMQTCVVNPFVQIVRLVRSGARPEVPPLEELPGPDSDACAAAGLHEYCQLMRCAG